VYLHIRINNLIKILLDSGSWKVMEFRKTIFQAWKVMENGKGHGKVMENDDDVMEFSLLH